MWRSTTTDGEGKSAGIFPDFFSNRDKINISTRCSQFRHFSVPILKCSDKFKFAIIFPDSRGEKSAFQTRNQIFCETFWLQTLPVLLPFLSFELIKEISAHPAIETKTSKKGCRPVSKGNQVHHNGIANANGYLLHPLPSWLPALDVCAVKISPYLHFLLARPKKCTL